MAIFKVGVFLKVLLNCYGHWTPYQLAHTLVLVTNAWERHSVQRDMLMAEGAHAEEAQARRVEQRLSHDAHLDM